VDDEAARDFALKLYDELLSGTPYGEAIRLAREVVFDRHGATNTWGAYQCYGDAQFVLRARPSTSYVAPLVSVSELTLAAAGVATEALAAGPRDVARLLQKLESLVTNSPADWLDDSCACAAVAHAYAELGAFDKAIQQYDRFATMERAEGPIRALEQLANLRARWAEQASAGNGDGKVVPLPEGETPESFFRRAEMLLQNLLAVGETAERYALVGSLHKRRAMAFSDAERRRAALTAMAEAYEKAYQRAHKDPQGRSWYPLPNWLAARIVLGWREGNGAPATPRGKRRPKGDDSVAEGLAELQRLTDGLAADGSTFWAAVLDGDRQLLAALEKRVLDADTSSAILNAYREAGRRGGSARQMSSVVDQVRFLASMAQSELKPDDGKALAASLNALAGTLSRD
jgi:tetratricopeptide (TPR) repeat protein